MMKQNLLITMNRLSGLLEMAKPRKYRYFMGDFETTVYKGQTSTEVWASALVEFHSEDVKIYHSIGETFDALTKLGNVVVYYHNLKFDGSFWIDYLINTLHFEQAWIDLDQFIKLTEEMKLDERKNVHPESLRDHLMPNKSFNYIISDQGQWYSIKIKYNHSIIELRDSLKLLPFSVSAIGDAFKTKHRKLTMEYEGFRYAGCTITDEEKKYIANDVLVVKEALEIMFEQGHNKLTIGACCLDEYKRIMTKVVYYDLFPNLFEIQLDPNIYGSSNVDEYIRKSYKGGWCYYVKGKENKVFHNGCTADVNSLYPSMMHSESGNKYPVGKPWFWKGNFIPSVAYEDDSYFFVRVKTRFYIKKDHLPFIQKKKTMLYLGTESLESSDVQMKDGKKYAFYMDSEGQVHDTRMELTLTETDYELLQDHYDLVDFEILDGCVFRSESGIFDEYIDKYKKIKMESKGAMRTLAKLFLNNLYGKMAASTESSFKIAVTNDKESIGFITVPADDKTPGYIAVGSAITSYARNFTIRTAQNNYYGKNKPGFIYADTDSIHCDLPPEKLIGVPVHPTDFCKWKIESCWDVAIFARQKTYIEHVTHEDMQKVDQPYYAIRCAGMPDKCKDLLNLSMTTQKPVEGKKYTDAELEFIKQKRTLKDFKVGLVVPGKLMPKRIKGGILLTETTYEMR